MIQTFAVCTAERLERVIVGHEVHAAAGSAREIEQSTGRKTAAPEERVYLSVLERVGRGVYTEPLRADVTPGIHAGRAQDPHRDVLGAAPTAT